METYSLADLTRITGAKRRSVQLWAEAGAIKANPSTERAGSGTHRSFSRDEAIIACLIHPFAMRQMAIGELLNVADAVRRHLQEKPDSREIIEDAISGKKSLGYLIMTTTTIGEWGATFWAPDEGVEDLQDTYREIGMEVARGILHEKLWKNPEAGPLATVMLLNTYLTALR